MGKQKSKYKKSSNTNCFNKVDIDDSLQHRTNLESIIQTLAMNTGNMWEYNGNQIKIRVNDYHSLIT